MRDADLRRALRRREPSAEFAELTLARIRAERAQIDGRDAPKKPSRVRAWIAAGLAVAASAAVTVGVVRGEAARRDAEGRQAAEKLEVALQITSETLQHVQMKVNHIGDER